MKGFDVTQIILSQPVVEAVLKARDIGRVLAGIEALLLAFVCWYRIHVGARLDRGHEGLVRSASSSAPTC